MTPRKASSDPETSRRAIRARRKKRIARLRHLTAVTVLCTVAGLLVGRLLGILFSSHLSLPALLFSGVPLGIEPPGHLDLGFFSATVGFTIRLNIMGIAGFFTGIGLYRRYFTSLPRRRPGKR